MQTISAQNLSLKFGTIQAVDNLSFDVEEGEIYGIIGPDGAGKTTLFRILTTLMTPDSGSALIDNLSISKDFRQIRNIIGYMPGKFSLYQDMSIEENLNFFATVFHTTIEENYHLIEDIYKQIEPFKKRRAGKLSGGMKQKLALCCALIHKPRVLFLDEPTTGVDPVSRKEFWEMLKRLKQQGITILVSTPYMDEAKLCDRIALMLNGKFLKVDTPQNITAEFSETLWSVKSDKMHQLLKDLRNHEAVKSSFSFGESYHVTVETPKSPKGDFEISPKVELQNSPKVELQNSPKVELQNSPKVELQNSPFRGLGGISQTELKNYLSKLGHEDIEIYEIEATVEDCFMDLAK